MRILSGKTFGPLCALLLLLAGIGHATDTEEYGPNDYRIIGHGMAPNHRFSIATHDYNSPYVVYLMAEPRHRKIGPLTEIDSILDNGPGSFGAAWSPDSRYVAINYRYDRHLFDLKLYRIAPGRAYPTKLPDPLTALGKQLRIKSGNYPSPREQVAGIKWLSPTRFVMNERLYSHSTSLTFAHAARRYTTIDDTEPAKDEVDGIKRYDITFLATATCEIHADGRITLTSVQPGKPNDQYYLGPSFR